VEDKLKLHTKGKPGLTFLMEMRQQNAAD